jgi:hypothetical protein
MTTFSHEELVAIKTLICRVQMEISIPDEYSSGFLVKAKLKKRDANYYTK